MTTQAATAPPDVPRSRTDEILSMLAERLGATFVASSVFGTPVERDGVTVIPVAMVVGGGGVGGAEDAGGGGFGGWSRGIGVYAIRDGEVRFVPATDRTLLIALAVLVWGRVMLRIFRRPR